MINPSTGVIRRAGSLKMIKKALDSVILNLTVDRLAFMLASSHFEMGSERNFCRYSIVVIENPDRFAIDGQIYQKAV